MALARKAGVHGGEKAIGEGKSVYEVQSEVPAGQVD